MSTPATLLAELHARLSCLSALEDADNAERVHALLAALAAATEVQAAREREHTEREHRRVAGLKARAQARKLPEEQRAKEQATVERLAVRYGFDRALLAEMSGLPQWRVREYLRAIRRL